MANVAPDTTVARNDRESPVVVTVLLGCLAAFIILSLLFAGKAAAQDHWTRVLSVVATLGIFTILYRENPLFRFLEHIFIGLATGFGVVYLWLKVMEPRWYIPMMPASLVEGGEGKWWLFFALLFGLLFFSVYFPKLSWMNRFAIGIIMGWAAGYALRAFVGLIGPQITAAFKAPITKYYVEGLPALNSIPMTIGETTWWWHPYWLISLIVLMCVLAYFFFSVEHRAGWIRKPAVAGRYLLMLSLGTIFGTTVMARLSLLIARFDIVIDNIRDWGVMILGKM
jgi:hypothetical protein